MNERDRAILAEYLRRQRAKRSGFAHAYVPEAPTTKQRAFLDDDGLEALYGGAAGGGKSSALLAAALKFVHVRGYSALLLRRSYTDLALPGALMDRSHKWLAGSDASWNGIEKRWRFPSGASLTFGYLETEKDKYRYQGAEAQMVGIDELTQWEEGHYTYLFSRLRRAGVDVPLRMRAATNPGGVGHEWVKKRWALPDDVDMDRVHEGRDGARFYPARLDDNPYIDREEYERSLSRLTHADQEQLRKGRWVQDASMLVYAFDRARDLVKMLPRLPSGMRWRYILAIDYGNVAATAFVVLAFCVGFSDCVWIVRSKKWGNLDPDDAAQLVRVWSNEFGGFERIVGDAGGLGKGYIVQAQNRFALPIEAAEKSDKLGAIKLINGASEKGRVLVVEGENDELVAELEQLRWYDETKTREHPRFPNHLTDARLYGWRETTAWMHTKPRLGPPKDSPEYHEQMDREAEQREIESAREEDETW